jgi:hypothetical protein
MTGPPDPALRPRTQRPRPWLAVLAPVVAALAVAHFLPATHLTLLQRLAAFGGMKVGADLLRGRAWPHGNRFGDDIAREWLAWACVACAYLLFVALAQHLGRPVPLPTWPALLAYWILWLP